MKYILGISAYYHDSSATIIKDGEILAAAQEERFTRVKGDSSFPNNAINYCLNEAKITIEEVDNIVFYENNLNKFQRIIVTHHKNSPKGLKSFLLSISKWLTKDLWLDNEIRKELMLKRKEKNKIVMYDHHMSHAASAFYPSPFKKAAILTIDGVGEWATTTYGIGEDNKIKLKKQLNFPDSIGLLYSAFTYYLGFKINFDEYKVMGLAPYGNPIYKDLIKEKLLKIYPDGSIKLNMKYFNYTKGITMINKEFEDLFDKEVRIPESEITQKDMDIAASLQWVLNEIVLKIAEHIYKETKCDNLVMAGGVALNVATIGYLKRNSSFKNIWVQPASGDAGGSLGCALSYYYDVLDNKRKIEKNDSMKGSFLGPIIKENDKDIDKLLKDINAKYEYLDEEKLIKKIVENLSMGKIIGIARDKMEYGPRALGHRSIIADPRVIDMQKTINLKIKYREGFRPFAPIVLVEDKEKYFEINDESPYMLSTYYVNKKIRKPINNKVKGLDLLNEEKSTIPAVTHVDYSSRVQTVDKKRNPFTYKLLKEFKKKTKCSCLVNTSFNVRGEPIVCNEIDAYNCFMNTEMDCVVIGNRFFNKEDQPNVRGDKNGR